MSTPGSKLEALITLELTVIDPMPISPALQLRCCILLSIWRIPLLHGRLFRHGDILCEQKSIKTHITDSAVHQVHHEVDLCFAHGRGSGQCPLCVALLYLQSSTLLMLFVQSPCSTSGPTVFVL